MGTEGKGVYNHPVYNVLNPLPGLGAAVRVTAKAHFSLGNFLIINQNIVPQTPDPLPQSP